MFQKTLINIFKSFSFISKFDNNGKRIEMMFWLNG